MQLQHFGTFFLDAVHQVDLLLRQITVAGDFFVLIFHCVPLMGVIGRYTALKRLQTLKNVFGGMPVPLFPFLQLRNFFTEEVDL